jgi:hypothetical protein
MVVAGTAPVAQVLGAVGQAAVGREVEVLEAVAAVAVA